jgi:hypothetical protein
VATTKLLHDYWSLTLLGSGHQGERGGIVEGRIDLIEAPPPSQGLRQRPHFRSFRHRASTYWACPRRGAGRRLDGLPAEVYLRCPRTARRPGGCLLLLPLFG